MKYINKKEKFVQSLVFHSQFVLEHSGGTLYYWITRLATLNIFEYTQLFLSGTTSDPVL